MLKNAKIIEGLVQASGSVGPQLGERDVPSIRNNHIDYFVIQTALRFVTGRRNKRKLNQNLWSLNAGSRFFFFPIQACP